MIGLAGRRAALPVVRRRMGALGAGIAAAFVLCLAIAPAIGALGCVEGAMLGICLGAGNAVTPTLLVVLAVVATAFTGAVVLEIVRHSRLARGLGRLARPAFVAGQRVGFVPGMTGAVVAGLARPAIYCSPDLIARLEDEELEAVLLHETHHQQTWAPLRLAVLTATGRFVAWSTVGRRWLVRRRAAIEIAADAHVLAAGLPRAVLARAIIKLYEGHAGGAAAGFASAADMRLRALLGERAKAENRPHVPAIAGGIAFIVTCVALM